MRKEALIVGVGSTRGYAEPLPGAVVEMQNWAGLLEQQYGFKVKTLSDAAATRDEVLKYFEKLITGVEQGDVVLLWFIGHGRTVKNPDELDSNYPFAEALIVYPKEGDTALASSEITDVDLAKIVRKVKLPAGTKFGVMVDACFAGYFDFPLPPGAKPMFIPATVSFGNDSSRVREFGSMSGPGAAIPARPIVIAACGREEEGIAHRDRR